jgi:hypothetical protein
VQFEIHYQRYGDVPRVKRGAGGDGAPQRFTKSEARKFLARNRHRYPRARFVPVGSSPKAPSADTRKRRHSK